MIRFPLPVFFAFVFTDAKGTHMYAACLRFYEIVPVEDLKKVFSDIYGDDKVSLAGYFGCEVCIQLTLYVD